MSTLQLIFAVVYFALGAGLIYLAIMIVRESFKVRLNRVTAAMLFLAGLGPIFAALGAVISPYQTDSPLKESPLYNLFFIWELFFPVLLYFSWVFPYDRLENKRSRWRWLIFVPHIFHILLLLLFSNTDKIFELLIAEPGSSGLWSFISETLTTIFTWIMIPLGLIVASHRKFFSLVNLGYVILAVTFLFIGMKHISTARLRQQVRIIILGIHLSLGVYIFTFILPKLITLELSETVTYLLGTLMLIVGAGSIAWAIIRYQFLDVQLIVRQSLVYTVSSGVLVGLYILAITQFSGMLESVLGEQSPIINIGFVVVALILFQPINNQIDNIIKRWFIRDKSDYRNIINSLSSQIINILDREQLFKLVEDTLRTSMQVRGIGFAIYDDAKKAYLYFPAAGSTEVVLHDTDPMLGAIGQLKAPTFYDRIETWHLGSPLATLMQVHGVHLIVPLNDRQHLLGFLVLTDKYSGFRFSYEDFTLLSTLSNQMVAALTNVRLYRESLIRQRLQEEMNLARQIQLNLLPDIPPRGTNFSIIAHSRPSRTVGGDFYDFVRTDDNGGIGIVIADVSGKGMPAALLAAQIQAALRSQIGVSGCVSDKIARVNDIISHLSSSSGKYATLFYGEFDPRLRQFEYSNAGHNYPLLMRSDGAVERLDIGGTVLGAFEGNLYESHRVILSPDDVIFCYTDGLSEAMNKTEEEFGEERIIDYLTSHRNDSPEQIRDGILKEVNIFTAQESPEDDTTIIILKMNEIMQA